RVYVDVPGERVPSVEIQYLLSVRSGIVLPSSVAVLATPALRASATSPASPAPPASPARRATASVSCRFHRPADSRPHRPRRPHRAAGPPCVESLRLVAAGCVLGECCTKRLQ